jgi:hypothetical protein
MDWERAWKEEAAALMRLAALLHALAGLAERAAGHCAGVRAFVLWLLRRAEALTRTLADDLATDPIMSAQFLAALSVTVGTNPFMAGAEAGRSGSRPEDALRLAASLRLLAFQLEALVALSSLAVGRSAGPHAQTARILDAVLAFLAPVRRMPAPDTS